jgi:alpha-N-acetylglucosamine transferase
MFDNAWIPYYYKVCCEYDKVKHLDVDQKIRKKLDRVFRLGGIAPLYTSYSELDEILEDIKKLFSKL